MASCLKSPRNVLLTELWNSYLTWQNQWKVVSCSQFEPIVYKKNSSPLPDQSHYNDVIMGAIASQIPSLTIVFSTGYLDTDQRKHQSSASLAFVWGIHRRPVNSPHKRPVTRKMFPFDDVIMAFCRSGHVNQRLRYFVLPCWWRL